MIYKPWFFKSANGLLVPQYLCKLFIQNSTNPAHEPGSTALSFKFQKVIQPIGKDGSPFGRQNCGTTYQLGQQYHTVFLLTKSIIKFLEFCALSFVIKWGPN